MLHSGGQCGPEYFIQPECFFWGLDIVAKIMNKYFHMELGKAMSLSGMCVALSAALVYDKKTVVLSVLGTYFNGIVLDRLFLIVISNDGSASLQKGRGIAAVYCS